jgi:MFS transporter, ACS family, tartrate transporter
MSIGAQETQAQFEERTIRMVRNRVIPLLTLGFVISYLDRVNVGVAALTLNKDIGLTAVSFGWGAGLVSIGYALFELPSNLALERFGARRWMARIMITWGIIGCATALVRGPVSFYVARFLLGAAEAGFFPGVILYLTYWFPRAWRARYAGLFALAIPVSSVVGAPLSALILGLNGFLGLKGWQWIYVLEASPAIVLGVLALVLLSDGPAQARWLEPRQREWLEATLAAERRAHPERHHTKPLAMLLDRRVLVLALIFFLTGMPSYGLGYWIPQVVKSFGVSIVATGFISALPFLAGAIALVIWGALSDRRGERAWNTAIPAFIAFLGLAAAAYVRSPIVSLMFICVAGVGIFGLKGPWLAMISETFSESTAAAGIALVSTLGNLSGFFAPWMIGVIMGRTHDFRIALVALGINALLGSVLVLAWGRGRRTS